MKKKMWVVVNPISGIGKQKRIESVFDANLNKDLYDYEIKYTEHIHHGTEIARMAADKGVDIVTAVGGDGSVNDVVSGLKGSPTTLGIIPCGSGNGLARCMNISLIPAFAVRMLNDDYEFPIDTIEVNGEHVVASIAGVGFDAYIARLMKTAKSRGLAAYLNLMVREYVRYECQNYHLTIDGKEYDRKAWFIAVANSNQFGFNANIAPQAKLNDGMLDISIVDKVPIEHLPVSVPLLYANHAELSQHVEIFKAKEVVISGNLDKWVNIDGEGEICGSEVRFVNIPNSLNVIGKRPLPGKIIGDIHRIRQKVHNDIIKPIINQ
ncbi:MAG: diacylglycerol kinase family lipid kinase [Bacteroidales bacterium]|nr:diacylglycerol kinase family lipid kinase [Bacteroidales bacterium]